MLSLEEYRVVFETAPDGCVIVDAEGIIRELNPQIESLFGWEQDELIGQAIEVLVPEAQRQAHEEYRTGFSASPRSRPMGIQHDLTGLRKNGSTFPLEVSLSPWKSPSGDLRVICAVRDVTERRRLRYFSKGALLATEEERQRIARELHDDTAQRLATLVLRMREVRDEELGETERQSLLDDIREDIIEAADGVRRIASGLRPPELGEIGLAAALGAYVRSLREGTGFQIQVELDHVDPFLDLDERLVIYRVVQEALSNVIRHADVNSARLRVGIDADSVFAEVSDKGKGFVTGETSESGGGLGLLGMRERSSLIGARLTIESAPGEGTRIRIDVSVASREG